MNYRRRKAIGLVCNGVLVTIAGCNAVQTNGTETQDQQSTGPETQVTTFKQGSASPPAHCEKGTPVEPYWSARGPGPIDGFRLSPTQVDVKLDNSFKISLKNISDVEKSSGVKKKKFDIQRRSDDGWETIYAKGDPGGPLDEEIYHDPGEGFTWEFSASKDGLTHTKGQIPDYYVCGDISSGEYRFVYWGVDRDNALTVPLRFK